MNWLKKIIWTLRLFNRMAFAETHIMHCLSILGEIGKCSICGAVRQKDHFELVKQGRVTEWVCDVSCVKAAKKLGWKTQGQVDAALQQQARKLAKESARNEDRKTANDPTEHASEQDGRPATGEEAAREQDTCEAAVEAATHKGLGDRP